MKLKELSNENGKNSLLSCHTIDFNLKQASNVNWKLIQTVGS